MEISKKVGMLSGGERGVCILAKTLIQGGNVLLLDEPSNDLDVETLRALEDALLEYAGTVLVISHDRWFLDRIATHILAAEGDSQWTFLTAITKSTKPTRKAPGRRRCEAQAHALQGAQVSAPTPAGQAGLQPKTSLSLTYHVPGSA